MSDGDVSPVYVNSLKLSLTQQIPCFVICLLLLDSGKLLRVCLIAILGFWLFAMVCLVRGHRQQDRLGLSFLKWGFLPLFGFLTFLNSYLHQETRH